MPIYIMRHATRNPEDRFFHDKLNEIGKKQSLEIVDELKKLNPDIIYSSPYVRCIETILPYVTLNNKKFNVDNCLTEYHYDINIIEKTNNIIIDHIKNTDFYDQILGNLSVNVSQEFRIKNKKILNETQEDLFNRVKLFIDFITQHVNLQKKTVLIVTHQSIVNAFKMMYNDNIKLDSTFEMCQIEKLL